MTTFSQLIDGIVLETSRLDLRAQFVSYLNQTIREVHFEPATGNVAFLKANYNEIQLTANLDSGYSWTIPNYHRLQGIQAVRFDSVWTNNKLTYAPPVVPGRKMNDLETWYQEAGDQLIFSGYGGVNGLVSIAYFLYPRSLKYYAVGSRPASYDEDDGWTYHDDYDADDDSKAAARDMVTNWLIMRWFMVLEEGLRAKAYKRISDDARAKTCYSLYAQQRRGLITSELADSAGVYYSA